MNKRIIIIIALLILAAFAFLFIRIDHSSQGLYVLLSPDSYDPLYPKSVKWEKTEITYSFSNKEDCGSQQASRISRAFEEIEKDTKSVLRFRQLESEEGEIIIHCHKGFGLKDLTSDGLFRSADATYFNNREIIRRAEINFYNTREGKISGCTKYPNTEVHEILHVLGLEHIKNRFHIMNPVLLSCPKKISDDVIDKLTEIYG